MTRPRGRGYARYKLSRSTLRRYPWAVYHQTDEREVAQFQTRRQAQDEMAKRNKAYGL